MLAIEDDIDAQPLSEEDVNDLDVGSSDGEGDHVDNEGGEGAAAVHDQAMQQSEEEFLASVSIVELVCEGQWRNRGQITPPGSSQHESNVRTPPSVRVHNLHANSRFSAPPRSRS